MRILVGADLVPTDTNFDLFQNGAAEKLVGKELLALLQSADYRIFNLEVPLTDISTPIAKCGPNLIAPQNTVNGYKALGIDCLAIANNHIMDQGKQGFASTVQALDNAGIEHVGGGETLENAAKPHVFTVEDKKIGIYACAEHEFSIATDSTPGANPFDPLESPDHIAKLKNDCDYVIVLYHGGKEHYRYPSPNLQKTCRKLVEKGADLVICQHSHCIGCEEKFLHGTIVYGQGNFLFDHSKSEYWKTGLLVQINTDFSISYLPLVKNENTVGSANVKEAEEIMAAFHSRSAEITQDGMVADKYSGFAAQMQKEYLRRFSGGKSVVFRALNKLSGGRFSTWYMKNKYTEEQKLALRNVIECEAHRELALYGLKNSDR